MDILAKFKKNQKQAVIFVVLALLIAFVLYFNFLLKPQVVGVISIFGKMRKMSSDLKNAEKEIGKVERYKKDIAAYDEKVSRYEKMLPVKQEIPSLLDKLSDMARGSGVKIVGIAPEIPKGPAEGKNLVYQAIPILIKAKSGYHELGEFMAKLESSDRFMKVADIIIKANSAAPQKHDIELLILTYILLDNRRP